MRFNSPQSGRWFDAPLSWLASLRIRLIVTYVFITVLSFVFLFLQLMEPVENSIVTRENSLMKAVARTLGTTIRSPLESTNEAYVTDLFWTQRRCRLYLSQEFPDLTIRVLDPTGRLLLDSSEDIDINQQDWLTWWHRIRFTRQSLAQREEVSRAIRLHNTTMWPFDMGTSLSSLQKSNKPLTLSMAMPIMRTNKLTKKRELAFIMYLERPAGPVLKDLHELRQRLNISLLTSLLITILVSIFLASNLSSGLNSATRIARAFAKGDVTQRMRASGRDEVGQLGAAFNQMADSLNRQEQLRRNLLADVSHELRTPLTAIAGCADTLTDGALHEDPAATERFLDIIMRESERMQRLVSDILELSKLQSGVVEIPRKPLVVIPLIDDAVEIASIQARQEGITIVWNAPASMTELTILGHEDRLAQSLRNLLDNAIHHTSGGNNIYVSLEDSPSEVVIHIRDEGQGIPSEDVPWVFDRFYRSVKGGVKTGGTGLGLAIVREIISAHQGSITVQSSLGHGTTFSLHLPRVQAEQMAAVESASL